MALAPGLYKLTNVKAGNALDLSSDDNTSVVGCDADGGDTQQWDLERTAAGWTFKNSATGLYLGFAGAPGNGVALAGVEDAQPWDIWPDEENPAAHRMFVHDTTQNIDLSGHGDPAPGTPVTLWEKTRGKNQTWVFERVESEEAPQGGEQEPEQEPQAEEQEPEEEEEPEEQEEGAEEE